MITIRKHTVLPAPKQEGGISLKTILEDERLAPLAVFLPLMHLREEVQINWGRVFQNRGLDFGNYDHFIEAPNGIHYFRAAAAGWANGVTDGVAIETSELLPYKCHQPVLFFGKVATLQGQKSSTAIARVFGKLSFVTSKQQAESMLACLSGAAKMDFQSNWLDTWTDRSFISIIGRA